MRAAFLIAVAVITTGCATMQSGKVPERFLGKSFEVSKDITFLADDYAVVFQKGQITRAGNLSVWDTNCKLLMEKPRQDSWNLTEGLYSITGFQRYSTNCTLIYCVDIQQFTLNTTSGPIADKLTCRQQYDIGDGSLGPEPITAERLKNTLGEYLRLKPAE